MSVIGILLTLPEWIFVVVDVVYWFWVFFFFCVFFYVWFWAWYPVYTLGYVAEEPGVTETVTGTGEFCQFFG